jgi:hypothetical protein
MSPSINKTSLHTLVKVNPLEPKT